MSAPEAIAVVGMACRVPGASTPEAFMEMLCRGVEAVRPESEWARADATPPPRPAFAGRAAGALEGVDLFDAAYFGITPREAELMDPQQRLFLECCAEALQRAGRDVAGSRVGVYAGAGVNAYFLERVLPSRRAMEEAAFQAVAMNEKDFLATQVSYRLDLTGPSLTVQSACSTSLVAVSLACEALLGHQCDLALAGGSAVKADPGYGSFLEEGGIMAEDGHCRAFDAKASGTVGGSAVGAVLLKRLSEAVADGDVIHAVIRGTAVNNDGARKVGFTAPSVEGQAAVVAEAHAVAGIDPAAIGYVEAHGTGTRLGDPIEVAALRQAFGPDAPRASCALGSVKTNVGHADAAAGVIGLIKAVLAVEQGRIPPTLHFDAPNPALKLDSSPFYVNRETIPFPGSPRRAGVSSFGIGGTNAHVVVEQAPPRAPAAPDPRPQALVLSARTPGALDALARSVADHVEAGADLADVAWTLQAGRRRLPHRRAVAARGPAEAAARLRGEARGAWSARTDADDLRVAFLFPGQGAQHVGMAQALYEGEPVFRREVDRCCELLRAPLGLDLREVLFPAPARRAEAERLLATTLCTQPAVFVVGHALAELWASWGVRPAAVLGHSLGEYVAARVAGVLSLEDALALVALRARLMEALPEGAMLAVPMAEAALRPLLPPGVSLAGVNGPESCVASGAPAGIDALAALLAGRGVEARRLRVSRAFHSAMMEPMLAEFHAAVARLPLRPPEIPLISNVTGRPLEAHEATDPAYWTRHLREAVRFADGVATLLADPTLALLEVGPGRTLTSLALRQAPKERVVLASLHHPDDAAADDAVMLREALGRLWLAGLRPDWAGVHAPGARRRAIVPTYPFERQRYWLDPPPRGAAAASDSRVLARGWRRALPPAPAELGAWLLLGGTDALAERLRSAGHAVERAPAGTRAEAEALLARLRGPGSRPPGIALVGGTLRSLDAVPDGAPLVVVTREAYDVTGREALGDAPLAAAALARGARVVDIEGDDPARVAAELGSAEALVALRGAHRWVVSDEPADAAAPAGARFEVTHTLPDLGTAAPDEVERALADEGRALDGLLAQGGPVALATSGGALHGLALARAALARRAGRPWRVVECAAWARADPADAARALAVDAPHVVVLAPPREAAAREAYVRPALAAAPVAPASPIEERLVALWEDAFGFRGIGVRDDFFELGGHSLLATRIVARVQEEFGVDVALPRFFEARTVADFAAVLEEALVEKLGAMSDEDAQRALEAR
jgi:acyl transferase domain-containing protein/acyl carrier protein